MKVEQLESTDDQVIDLSAKQEMKMIMSGDDSPPIDIVQETDPTSTEDIVEQEEEKEPEKSEPTIQEQLQAQAEKIDKLTRALDKTNGTYGNELNHLRRKLAEVESQKREVFKSIAPSQLKRLTAAYPELAGDLAEDLNEAFGIKDDVTDTVVAPTKNDPRIDSLSESTGKLADQVKQIALNELTRAHPDWSQVAQWNTETIPGVGNVIKFGNPDFGAWVNQQDQDIKDVVFNSEDIAAISQVITRFKSDRAAKAEYQPITKPAINKKLEKAVLPTGRRTGSHELLTEDEVIMQAAREEQKRHMNGY